MKSQNEKMRHGIMFASNVNHDEYDIVGHISCDGSCRVLPVTQYDETVVAWSKNYNFDDPKWYKAYCTGRSRFLIANTQRACGIDVNAFLGLLGCGAGQFTYEHEVLFPLQKEYVVKEYECTPRQFHRYMRNYPLDLTGY